MPLLKINDVVSFSSEDPVHVAENIKSSEPSKKWKCQKAGEKSSSIVLKLEKASVISSIHIGNEGSAYVEVLVNRTDSNADFKVLLVMSSFMTPVEARNATNINKVRIFTTEQLSKPECTEKWDRIKIVCTQPFNKHIQYGLSFISFYSPEDKSETTSVTSFGKFAVRPESPVSGLQIGSLFARRKELQNEPKAAASSIREASSTLNVSKACSPADSLKRKKTLTIVPNPKKPNLGDTSSPNRNRNELLYKDDDGSGSEKMEKAIQMRDQEKEKLRKEKELKEEQLKKEKEKLKKEKQKEREKERASQSQNVEKTPNKKETSKNDNRQVTPKVNKNDNKQVTPKVDTKKINNKPKQRMKPFNKLLEGVTIVISGIQNPERADIRTAALQMGAKYKPDWENSCTHLICAFQNTPKFNQVKGRGKIVTKKWILECKKQRKHLPWRRFALDPSDKKDEESEEEIWELTDTQDDDDDKTDDEIMASSSTATTTQSDTATSSPNITVNKESDEDTEDEIERIKAKKKTETNNNGEKLTKQKNESQQQQNSDTEEEIIEKINHGKTTPELPDFLTDHVFYIDEDIPEDTRKLLTRYIIAFNGKVSENFTASVTTIISTEDTCSILKTVNPEATFVSQNWIWECHNQQKCVKIDKFLL